MQHIPIVVNSHYSIDELELFCFLIDLRPQTQTFQNILSHNDTTILSTRIKSHNLVNKHEILSARMQQTKTQSKQTERFLNFKSKNCNGEFASSRSYDFHRRHQNGVAGEPPAGASLPSSLQEDARRSPTAASPPSRARLRRRPARASYAE